MRKLDEGKRREREREKKTVSHALVASYLSTRFAVARGGIEREGGF